MYRIGILGAENSHAEAFAKLFNCPDAEGNFPYPDCRVVAVGGHYPEENERLFKEFGLEILAGTPADMLGRVDAVMVTARDGQYHMEFALPFVEAGIPAFIDKPFTVSEEDALRLARAAAERNVPLCGGSSVKYAYDVRMLENTVRSHPGEIHGASVAAPLNMVNPYSGFYFYSSHLAEIMLTVFGNRPRSVTAFRKDNDVTAVTRYDDYFVSNHFMDDLNAYHGAVYCSGRVYERDIDISLCYRHECDVFVSMLRTGKGDGSLDLIAPVFYLNAVERSYETGVTQEIRTPQL